MKGIAWVNVAIGIWLIFAPWLLPDGTTSIRAVNDVTLGILLVAFSWWMLFGVTGSRRGVVRDSVRDLARGRAVRARLQPRTARDGERRHLRDRGARRRGGGLERVDADAHHGVTARPR